MNKLQRVSKYVRAYESDKRFGANGMSDLAFTPENGGSNAGATPENVSKPYILFITNSGASPLDAVIFGQSRNYLLTNFGSPPGIAITTPSGVTYPQLLMQSASNPFDIGQWKITSTSGSAQLDNEVLVTYFDANRRACSDPVDINKDAYQFDPNQVVFWYPVKIDGNTQLNYTVLAGTTVTMKLYPNTVIVPSRPIIGGSTDKSLVTPKISGLNSVNVNVSDAKSQAQLSSAN